MQRTEPEGVAMRWLSVTPRAVYHVSGPLALCHIEREVQRLLQSWFKTTCIVFYNNNSAGLGLGLGLDPSVISRQGVADLPTRCWWSTDFAGDLPTFAGEFPSSLVIYRLLLVSSRQLVTSRRFGDLPIFSSWCPDLWWFPDFFYLCLLYWC